jgi:hypothetical protein
MDIGTLIVIVVMAYVFLILMAFMQASEDPTDYCVERAEKRKCE